METQKVNPRNYGQVKLVMICGRNNAKDISEIPEGYKIIPSGASFKKTLGKVIVNTYVCSGDPCVIETLMEKGYLAMNYPNIGLK